MPLRLSEATVGDSVERFVRADGTTTAAVVDEHGDVQIPFSLAGAFNGYTFEEWTSAIEYYSLSRRPTWLSSTGSRRFCRGELQLALRRLLIAQARACRASRRGRSTTASAGCCSSMLAARSLAAGADRGRVPLVLARSSIRPHSSSRTTSKARRASASPSSLPTSRRSSGFGRRSTSEPGTTSTLPSCTSSGVAASRSGHTASCTTDPSSPRERRSRASSTDSRRPQNGSGPKGSDRLRLTVVHGWLAELPFAIRLHGAELGSLRAAAGRMLLDLALLQGPLVELPYTLPQDHTLLTLLRHRTPDLWLEQAAAIERQHGLIQCVSHPDRGYMGDADKRAIYAEFLRGMADREGIWRALPRDVASWWRRRASRGRRSGVHARPLSARRRTWRGSVRRVRQRWTRRPLSSIVASGALARSGVRATRRQTVEEQVATRSSPAG